MTLDNPTSGPFVLTRHIVDPTEFVRRWEPVYFYKLESLYECNIRQPLDRAGVKELFKWKNGGRLSRQKAESVRRNYLDRIAEVTKLDRATNAGQFLDIFSKGGAIWRIFWLHIWAPDRFPIYDQHVHRAMMWIEEGAASEIPSTDDCKIQLYLDRYIPFYARFPGINERLVDKALWACGKAMKSLVGAPIE